MKPAPTVAALKRELTRVADPERVGSPAWFKTEKGDYSEHDKFIGVGTPMLRAIAAKYHQLKLAEIEVLLASRIHEYRFAGLLILVAWYEDGDAASRQRVFDFYLGHTHRVNNWDLVDTSAPYIVGSILYPDRGAFYIVLPIRVIYGSAELRWWRLRHSFREATLAIPLQLRSTCSPTGKILSTKRLAGCYGKQENIRAPI